MIQALALFFGEKFVYLIHLVSFIATLILVSKQVGPPSPSLYHFSRALQHLFHYLHSPTVSSRRSPWRPSPSQSPRLRRRHSPHLPSKTSSRLSTSTSSGPNSTRPSKSRIRVCYHIVLLIRCQFLQFASNYLMTILCFHVYLQFSWLRPPMRTRFGARLWPWSKKIELMTRYRLFKLRRGFRLISVSSR